VKVFRPCDIEIAVGDRSAEGDDWREEIQRFFFVAARIEDVGFLNDLLYPPYR
jgi:hypothetical protein